MSAEPEDIAKSVLFLASPDSAVTSPAELTRQRTPPCSQPVTLDPGRRITVGSRNASPAPLH